jgi:DNA replication protein DnaC
MLTHPILENLRALRLSTMAKTLEEQMNMPDAGTLTFEERLGLMVDRELTERGNRRLQTRLRKAKLRVQACMEDIDYRSSRKLDRSVMKSLASCNWIDQHQSVLVTGPTGAGKTWIACALGHRACMEGYSVLYKRLPGFLREFSTARADGSYGKLIKACSKTDLLIIDDWGLKRLDQQQSLDLLELLEDRYNLKSTIVAAQIPADKWHETIADPTLADAILDRLIHNSHRIELKGESMRKKKSGLTDKKKKD